MWLIPLFIVVVLAAGIVEKQIHQRNINAIPIRVNVNGSRGKSTVTRLITGVLKQAGKRTIGKTTGTMARLIYWNTEEEVPIKRRLEGPNIREQKLVVAEAAKKQAEALVSECMAVNPDYQITFQEQMVQANIGVIVNVLEDHMDEMGPTLDEVAESFTSTIPYRGQLIISTGPYVSYFKKVAKRRRTRVIVADPDQVPDEYLTRFEYMIFPEHIALTLAVAQALEVDEALALEGMVHAHPDPYVTRIFPIGLSASPSYFVNGFAANDATSTLSIWDSIEKAGYPTRHAVVIMNCREDRVDRTEQFARDVLPHIPMETLIVIGEVTRPIAEAYQSGQLLAQQLINLEGESTAAIVDQLKEYESDRVIYGIGNIHGAAMPLIEHIEKESLAKSKQA